jgi:hypothetical protein
VPAEWPGFSIRYLHGRSGPRRTPYLITVERKPQADATAQISIDGRVQKPGRNVVDLVDDGATHSVHVSWRSALAAGNLAATQAP